MAQINWGRLVEEDRAKGFGVPWTDEELHAIRVLGIPVRHVRKGITNLYMSEQERRAEERDGKISATVLTVTLKKSQIMKLADKMGISYDRDSVTVPQLRESLAAFGMGERVLKEDVPPIPLPWEK